VSNRSDGSARSENSADGHLRLAVVYGNNDPREGDDAMVVLTGGVVRG